MTARVTEELSVGLTAEIWAGLQAATEIEGSKPSQFGRRAIMEKLVREGYLQHPAQKYVNAANGTK